MSGYFPGSISLIEQLDSALRVLLHGVYVLLVRTAICAVISGSPSLPVLCYHNQSAEKILVVLRDGRHLVGYIRSFDQFSNIILEDTYERHVADGMFCDIELGLNIIRCAFQLMNCVVVGRLICELICVFEPFVYANDMIDRGDNIVLLGELDEMKERDQPHMKRASIEEILEAEERLNAKGAASVREQWDFDVSSS